MFVYLRFGACKPIIVNPDCAAVSFWSYVKDRFAENGVSYNENAELELSDTAGNVKDVRLLEAMQQVGPLLAHRKTYVPISYETTQEEQPFIVPLLDENADIYNTLIAKFRRQQKPTRRSLSPKPVSVVTISKMKLKRPGGGRTSIVNANKR